MKYTHAHFWVGTDGFVWHALSCPGTHDLSMGVLRSYEVDRIIAWCESHHMTIVDDRGTK